MTKMQDLVSLLEQLLANKDNLPDHTARDPVTNKLLHVAPKDKKDTWFMQLIHEEFPDEPWPRGDCFAIGSCLKHLIGKYVTTAGALKRVTTLLKDLQPYIAASQSQYYSDMKVTMSRTFTAGKDKNFLDRVAETWIQTSEQKAAQNVLIPSSLPSRMKKPIEFDLPDVLNTVRSHVDTERFAEMGILLETAVGTRSIDLLHPAVMEMKLHATNPKMVVLTGHSKVRSDGAWEEAKGGMLDVEPVGMSPTEAVAMLARYRTGIPEIINKIKVDHKDAMKDLTTLQKLQYVNAQLGVKFNARLGNAAKQLFPKQATFAKENGRKFATHAFRALHANAAYEMYGDGESEDVFFMNRLQHSGFGSVANYKTVRIKGHGQGSGVSAQLVKDVADLLGRVNTLDTFGQLLQNAHEQVNVSLQLAQGLPVGPALPIVPPVVKKRKCPDVPNYKPEGDQYAVLTNRLGTGTHVFLKYQIPRFTPEATRRLIIQDAEAKLDAHDIPRKNVPKLGIGFRCFNLLRSDRHKPLPNYTCTDYDREWKGPSKCK